MVEWDEDLRDEQRLAAGAHRGHLVLLAGPGTGKTHVLIRRIQYLIQVEGIDPREITALTFSRAAAAEMRHRLDEGLGDESSSVRVSTLHAYALSQILRHGGRGIPLPVRVAGDWEERWIIVEELARLLGRKVSEVSNNRDGALDRLADDWDTLAVDGRDWEEGYPDPKFLGMWRRHREVYGYTLRSELVYQLLCELRADPALAPPKTAVFLVDEYQDLNKCDLQTVRHLSDRAGAEVFAAGDDDQSIYSFRSAAPAGVRQCQDDYTEAQKQTLSECMRCGPAVVDLANWLIEQEADREPKQLVSVTEWQAVVELARFQNQAVEVASVARGIRSLIDNGVAPHSILVLAKSDRNGQISGPLEGALAELDVRTYLPRRAAFEARQCRCFSSTYFSLLPSMGE
jgi:DNA helicase II / ATP-dependent DNA helicase PcrA